MGVLLAPVSSAGETPISLWYAGSGWETDVDGFVPDGEPVSLTTATQKGTFGDSTLTITTEWVDDASVSCPDGYPIKKALVYSGAVANLGFRSIRGTVKGSVGRQ
jgi:hypothetical protein